MAEELQVRIIAAALAAAVILAVLAVRVMPFGHVLVTVRGKRRRIHRPGVVVVSLTGQRRMLRTEPYRIPLPWLSVRTADGLPGVVSATVAIEVVDPIALGDAHPNEMTERLAGEELRAWSANRLAADLARARDAIPEDLLDRLRGRLEDRGIALRSLEIERIELVLDGELLGWAHRVRSTPNSASGRAHSDPKPLSKPAPATAQPIAAEPSRRRAP